MCGQQSTYKNVNTLKTPDSTRITIFEDNFDGIAQMIILFILNSTTLA